MDPVRKLPAGCRCYWSNVLGCAIPAKGCPVHPTAYLRACAGCGERCDPDDMLEASLPTVVAEMQTPTGPILLTPLTLCWVGTCCAQLANPDQPTDPGFFTEGSR
jgi:hypothetical protein